MTFARKLCVCSLSLALYFALPIYSQSVSSSGTIRRTVIDPSGAAIKGATVEIHNPVSGYNPSTQTDAQGNFQFQNVPYNNYHLTAWAAGFQTTAQDVDVRTPVPLELKIGLKIGTSTTTVNVEAGGDLIETEPTTHTDIDRGLFQKLPLESQSSSLSSLVTLASPGVAADSNGLPDAKSFALIMTRFSTKRLTCNINPGKTGHGSGSTGAMTADWLPVRCPVRAAIAPTARPEPIRW